jgi:hypothetical protein
VVGSLVLGLGIVTTKYFILMEFSVVVIMVGVGKLGQPHYQKIQNTIRICVQIQFNQKEELYKRVWKLSQQKM